MRWEIWVLWTPVFLVGFALRMAYVAIKESRGLDLALAKAISNGDSVVRVVNDLVGKFNRVRLPGALGNYRADRSYVNATLIAELRDVREVREQLDALAKALGYRSKHNPMGVPLWERISAPGTVTPPSPFATAIGNNRRVGFDVRGNDRVEMKLDLLADRLGYYWRSGVPGVPRWESLVKCEQADTRPDMGDLLFGGCMPGGKRPAKKKAARKPKQKAKRFR